MNIGQIKTTIAAYLQVDQSQLITGGVDLLLIACNNARRFATRMHDWNCEEVRAYGTLTDGVGNWRNLSLISDDSSVTLKQPESFYLQYGEDLLVVRQHSMRHGAIAASERNTAQGISSAFRYLNDGAIYRESLVAPFRGTSYNAYIQGETVTFVPTPSETTTFVVDGYRRFDDYANDSDEDFFTDQGSDFLIYGGIVEANLLVKQFVNRQEGNVDVPERARDDALASLVEEDNYLIEAGRAPYKR
jgi:hypothetical protein